MDGGCRTRRRATHEVLEHLLGDEGHDRCEQTDERGQRLVQGLVGGERVALRAGLPETRTVPAHVPGREVVPEGLHLQAGGLRVVSVERSAHVTHQAMEARGEPTVDERAFARRYYSSGRVEPV